MELYRHLLGEMWQNKVANLPPVSRINISNQQVESVAQFTYLDSTG